MTPACVALLGRQEDRLQVGNVELGSEAQQHVIDGRGERQHGDHHAQAEQRKLRQPEGNGFRLRPLP
jgi:hypothetical protein